MLLLLRAAPDPVPVVMPFFTCFGALVAPGPTLPSLEAPGAGCDCAKAPPIDSARVHAVAIISFFMQDSFGWDHGPTSATPMRSCREPRATKLDRDLTATSGRRQQPRRFVISLAVAVEEQRHQPDADGQREQRAENQRHKELRRHRPARLAQSEIGKGDASGEQECQHGEYGDGACTHDRSPSSWPLVRRRQGETYSLLSFL